MADIKWIKIHTGMFDDEKIKLLDSMPDRDAVLVIWLKLLTLAGKVNNNGLIYVNEDLAYTDEMLSAIFNRPISVVKMALGLFNKFKMIETFESKLHICNWEKHQNVDGMEKIRLQNKERVIKHRNKLKQLGCNVTVTLPVTQCNAIDKEEEEEEDNTTDDAVIEKKEKKVYLKLPDIERIKLTQEDLDKLTEKFKDKELIWKCIQEADTWLMANGKKMKSDRHYLINWIKRALTKEGAI